MFTTKTLATKLGVAERTLDKWAYLGTGPDFVKVGKFRRYEEDAVERWLAGRRRGGARAA